MDILVKYNSFLNLFELSHNTSVREFKEAVLEFYGLQYEDYYKYCFYYKNGYGSLDENKTLHSYKIAIDTVLDLVEKNVSLKIYDQYAKNEILITTSFTSTISDLISKAAIFLYGDSYQEKEFFLYENLTHSVMGELYERMESIGIYLIPDKKLELHVQLFEIYGNGEKKLFIESKIKINISTPTYKLDSLVNTEFNTNGFECQLQGKWHYPIYYYNFQENTTINFYKQIEYFNPNYWSIKSEFWEFARIIPQYPILEFWSYFTVRFPSINPFISTPGDEIRIAIKGFEDEYSIKDFKDFIKIGYFDYFNPSFSGFIYTAAKLTLEGNITDAINLLSNPQQYQLSNLSNSFKRFQQIEYHGFFLFLSVQKKMNMFIKEYWKDLNSLTGDFIDIYYSKSDAETKSGHQILEEFKSLKNIEVVLPSFILWEKNAGLKNSIAISLIGLDSSQIYNIIQVVVLAIKNHIKIEEIAKFVQDKTSEILKYANIYIVHGDFINNKVLIIGDYNTVIQGSNNISIDKNT